MQSAAVLTAIAVAGAAVSTAASAQITPGQWEIASTITSIQGSAIPPQVAKMMTGKTVTVKNCVTPEQAKQGPMQMLKGSKTCTVAKFNMVGGRYTSQVVCKQGGMTITTSGQGVFTPTTMSGQGRAVMTGAQSMIQTQTMVGRRVGAC
jgi:hypothetical protein